MLFLEFNQKVFSQSLELFWKGMAAIIIAMLLICCATIVLTYFTKAKKDK